MASGMEGVTPKKKVSPAPNNNIKHDVLGQEIVPVVSSAVFWWVSVQEAKDESTDSLWLYSRVVLDRGVDMARLHAILDRLYAAGHTITFQGTSETGMTLWDVTDLEGAGVDDPNERPLPELLDFIEAKLFSTLEEPLN